MKVSRADILIPHTDESDEIPCCIVCGRVIKAKKAYYVYETNKEILDKVEYEATRPSDVVGAVPVGAECRKSFPKGFKFNVGPNDY